MKAGNIPSLCHSYLTKRQFMKIYVVLYIFFRWGFGGNDKCVRQTSGWQVAINGALVNDNNFQLTCENPPIPTAVPTTTTTPTTGPTTPTTPTPGPTIPATPTTGPTTPATPTTGPNTPATPTTGPTTAAISTAGPTTQATPCYECKNVLNGPLQGIYTLRVSEFNKIL